MAVESSTQQVRTTPDPWDVSVVDTPLSQIPGVPVYVQIRESLRGKIDGSPVKPGQRIPSEDELAGWYGVSRMTIRRAISELIDEGLLYRTHGVGTFIARPQLIRDHSRLTDFLQDPAIQDLEPQVEILSIEVVPASAKIAQALALPEGEAVICVETLRSLNGVPVTLSCEYTAGKLMPKWEEKDLSSHALWAVHERNGWKVSRAVEQLEARPAPQASADLLQVKVGAPTLYKERTVFAEDGTPIDYQECYSRGDKYTCTVVLRR
jgi:GntR family transcriptional regulator